MQARTNAWTTLPTLAELYEAVSSGVVLHVNKRIPRFFLPPIASPLPAFLTRANVFTGNAELAGQKTLRNISQARCVAEIISRDAGKFRNFKRREMSRDGEAAVRPSSNLL